jgi:hypothetical protein
VAADGNGHLWLSPYGNGLYVMDLSVVENNHPTQPELAMAVSNAPNPFNPETTIRFSLPASGLATVEIFNIKGQKVRTLMHEPKNPGSHSLIWNGKNDQGKSCSSGVYFCRIQQAQQSRTIKMALLK